MIVFAIAAVVVLAMLAYSTWQLHRAKQLIDVAEAIFLQNAPLDEDRVDEATRRLRP